MEQQVHVLSAPVRHRPPALTRVVGCPWTKFHPELILISVVLVTVGYGGARGDKVGREDGRR